MKAAQQSECSSAGPSADTFAASVVLLFGLTAVQRLVGFGRSVVFCRWLDSETLGQWDMAFSFLLLAAPLVMLGLPGSFGRYAEHYRGRGQLLTLLRRMTTFIAVVTVLSVAGVWAGSDWLGRLIFGVDGLESLVVCLALCLGAMIVQNFLTSLFASLRMYRVVSAQQLATTLVFAALSIGLLLGWQMTAASVVVAYGTACLLASLGAMFYLRTVWRAQPVPKEPVTHRRFWGKMLRLAVWIWVANWLTHLFGIVDRYMIIHFGLHTDQSALAVVGQYHSSRIVPLLFVGLAELLATMAMPYFSHDWERGRREDVSRRLNLVLKSFGFAMGAGAVLALALAPLLFGMAFDGKFPEGQAVFPLTLTYCVWLGMIIVAQNYLYCAEKARVVSIALAVGLTANVVLNLLLLPRLGLLGAVLATTAGVLIVFSIVMTTNLYLGMRFDVGTFAVALVPAFFWFGPWAPLAALVTIALAAVYSNRLLDADEKALLKDTITDFWLKARAVLGWRNPRKGLEC